MFNVHAHAADYIIKAAHCYIDLVAHIAILIYSLMHDHVANCHYCPCMQIEAKHVFPTVNLFNHMCQVAYIMGKWKFNL